MAAEMSPADSDSSVALADADFTVDSSAADAAAPFVGRWNRLVSTTNWEKGKIIAQWRELLANGGASVSDYSDEAWANIVGGVTSQHVGRLRRVYQRFGDVYPQFEGLFWSHFQAGIDWEDAEMWFEGAVLNSWSVSQMRGKRWETVGKPGEAPPFDADDDAAESDAAESDEHAGDGDETAALGSTAVEKSIEAPKKRDPSDDEGADTDDATSTRSDSRDSDRESPAAPAKSRQRLSVEVDELPEDLADAFEQFKLAIIAQRRLGWSETTPDAVIECLDALRELALAPSDN